jgi:hypothetical protein
MNTPIRQSSSEESTGTSLSSCELTSALVSASRTRALSPIQLSNTSTATRTGEPAQVHLHKVLGSLGPETLWLRLIPSLMGRSKGPSSCVADVLSACALRAAGPIRVTTWASQADGRIQRKSEDRISADARL